MREFFVANISMETNIHDLKWHFTLAGPVESVQLFEDPYSNETKQYAIVKMWRNTQAYNVFSLLQNRKVKNNIIIVLPAYKFKGDYIHILYELRSLLSRDETSTLKDAANFLIELECVNKHNFRRSKNILLNAIRESAVENQLNVNHIARTIEDYLRSVKKINKLQKRKRKRSRSKRSRSIRTISTPMGGQPPRKRR